MAKKQEAFLFVISLIILASRPHALELPYEVLDTIMELTDADPDFADLNRVNISDDLGPTRPIYRLDLDPNFIAYYEVDTGSDYVVLASGSQTGDYRKVESGPDPRPTDVLVQRAEDNGEDSSVRSFIGYHHWDWQLVQMTMERSLQQLITGQIIFHR